MGDNITHYPSLRHHTPYHYFRKSELEKISKNRIYVKSIAFVSSGTTIFTLFMAGVTMNKDVFSPPNYFFLQKMCYYRLFVEISLNHILKEADEETYIAILTF